MRSRLVFSASTIAALILTLAGVLAATALSASASELVLNYALDSTNSGAVASVTFGQRANSQSAGVGVTSQATPWSLPLQAVIGSDRTQVFFAPSTIVDRGSPIVVDGQFNLGFSGTVPYTVTIDSLTFDTSAETAVLAPDASFLSDSLFFGKAHMAGTVNILGTTSAFSIALASDGGGITGQFSPATDLSSVGFQFNGPSSTYNWGGGFIWQGKDAGFDLAILGSPQILGQFGPVSAVPTPEPSTATLLGAGAAGFALFRRHRPRGPSLG